MRNGWRDQISTPAKRPAGRRQPGDVDVADGVDGERSDSRPLSSAMISFGLVTISPSSFAAPPGRWRPHLHLVQAVCSSRMSEQRSTAPSAGASSSGASSCGLDVGKDRAPSSSPRSWTAARSRRRGVPDHRHRGIRPPGHGGPRVLRGRVLPGPGRTARRRRAAHGGHGGGLPCRAGDVPDAGRGRPGRAPGGGRRPCPAHAVLADEVRPRPRSWPGAGRSSARSSSSPAGSSASSPATGSSPSATRTPTAPACSRRSPREGGKGPGRSP